MKEFFIGGSIEEAPRMRFEPFEGHTLVAYSKREQSIHMKDTQKVHSKEATKGPFEGYTNVPFKRPLRRRQPKAHLKDIQKVQSKGRD